MIWKVRILTQELTIREEQNWLVLLKNAISDPQLLLKTLNLSEQDFIQSFGARKSFALRVPQPFIAKMEKGNPQDPLFLQVMCSDSEFIQAQGFSADPLEEQGFNAVPNAMLNVEQIIPFRNAIGQTEQIAR